MNHPLLTIRSVAAMGLASLLMLAFVSGCNETSSSTSGGPTKSLTVVTKDNFESLVINSDKPVLLDFWAPWCGPCRALMPTMEELAGHYDGEILIAKVNVDEQPELAQKFNVSAIPRLIFFRDGKVVIDEGGRSKKDLEKEIEAVLK